LNQENVSNDKESVNKKLHITIFCARYEQAILCKPVKLVLSRKVSSNYCTSLACLLIVKVPLQHLCNLVTVHILLPVSF